jgi:hypothetical protein
MSERVSGVLSSRTRLQRFLATLPLSSFKKLVISTPQLVRALCTMSLVKAVPKGINDWGSAKGLPYKNALRYHTYQKKIPSKNRFLSSKVTRV